jgi:hypothetical protein
MLRALRILEQQRRPAGLDRAVDDLRHLEVGVDLRGDADELALAFEERDPVAKILQRRWRSQWVSSPIVTTDRKMSPTTSIERMTFFPSSAAVAANRWSTRLMLTN